MPLNPENLEVILVNNSQTGNQTSQLQFFLNMKFNHNNISFLINPDCGQEKETRLLKAFELISEQIEIINFFQVYESPDIEIICSENKNSEFEENKDYFIAGEGGAREIIKSGDYNVITDGVVFLYKYPFKTSDCNIPVVEVHEILHVFGFDHSSNKDSLMNPLISSCKQKLDSSIVLELKKLYSLDNLADLKIEDLRVVKKGRYIDFNITIKNSGVLDAENVNLTIFDDGDVIDDRQLGEIKFGAGMTIKVVNLKLANRNPQKIEFIVDRANNNKEFDKNNNIAEIKINDI